MFTRPAVAIALLLTAASAAPAQQVATTTRAWELRIPSGGLIATGAQRDHLKNGQMTGIQLSRTVRPSLAITGTFGWARSQDIAAANTPKLDVFTSDIGLEACSHQWVASAPVSFNSFAGFGGGVRSYNYRKLDVDATNNLAGYVAAGGELGVGRVALRIEARDYVTGFKPLTGAGKSETRNDVVVMAAFRFNRRPAEAR